MKRKHHELFTPISYTTSLFKLLPFFPNRNRDQIYTLFIISLTTFQLFANLFASYLVYLLSYLVTSSKADDGDHTDKVLREEHTDGVYLYIRYIETDVIFPPPLGDGYHIKTDVVRLYTHKAGSRPEHNGISFNIYYARFLLASPIWYAAYYIDSI